MLTDAIEVRAEAFIPGKGLGGSKLLTSGPFMGRYAVALPFPLISRPIDSLWHDLGYLADDREPSLAKDRTSRMTILIRFDPVKGEIIEARHWSDPTTEVNMKTGAFLGTKISPNNLISLGVPQLISNVNGVKTWTITARRAGHDPFVVESSLTPIRLRVVFNIIWDSVAGTVEVEVDAEVTPYPAFQASAKVGSEEVILKDLKIEDTATVLSLLDGGRYIAHSLIPDALGIVVSPSKRMTGSHKFFNAPKLAPADAGAGF